LNRRHVSWSEFLQSFSFLRKYKVDTQDKVATIHYCQFEVVKGLLQGRSWLWESLEGMLSTSISSLLLTRWFSF